MRAPPPTPANDGPAPADALTKLRARYTDLIRKKGITSPVTEAKARELGVDVDALIAAREQIEFAARNHSVGSDLSLLDLGTNDWKQDPAFARWNDILLSPGDRPPRVDLPGVGFQGEIGIDCQNGITLSSLLIATVETIQSELRHQPRRYRHILPLGAKDLLIDRITLSDGWTVWGGLNPRVMERTPSKLHPARSIELLRTADGPSPPVAARPWPELDRVWVVAERWPDGKTSIVDAFETREECPPERTAIYPHLPNTIIIPFPSDEEFDRQHPGIVKPATHFLKAYLRNQARSGSGELTEHAAKTIYCDYSAAIPATDLRGAMRSGFHGPAPLPAGAAWPVCMECGQTPWFIESLDFRDAPFGKLLPGSTLAIFLCDRCLEAGEGTNGTTLVWLPREGEIALLSIGPATPAVQARQWIDFEIAASDDQWEELEKRWPKDFPYWFAYPIESGTKVGGIPNYIQNDPTYFDATGCLMEYIAQFSPPDSLGFDGGCYILHSTTAGETVADYQPD